MFVAMVEELVDETSAELDAVIEEAELARRAAEARLAAATAVISERGSFRDDGYRSMRAYLKGRLNCSGTVANRIRRRAAMMNAHSEVGELLVTGRIGVEQADLLGRAHAHRVAGERFAEFAPQLLEHAEHLEHADFDTVIDHFIRRADPDGSFDDQQFHEDERTAWVAEVDGAVEVPASGGDPLAAAEMKAVFDHAVEAEFHKDCDTRRVTHGEQHLEMPLPRTARQRKFDALHAIFLASVTTPDDGKRPEPIVNVVIDHATAGRALHDHGLVDTPDLFDVGPHAFSAAETNLLNQRCTINDTAVHPDVALHAMITGRVRRAVVDADSVTIDLGRTRRLFTGNTRDAAQLLVTNCTHPGCDIPARFCDVDHRAEWHNDGGATDQTNAMIGCGSHNRWKHRNRIRTRRATNGRIHLIRSDNTVIMPIGATEPEWAEPHPANNSPPAARAPESRPDERSTESPPRPETFDPLAAFGRPLTEAEVATRMIAVPSGVTVYITDIETLTKNRAT